MRWLRRIGELITGGPRPSGHVRIDGRPATTDDVGALERLTHVDLDGDGRIDGGRAAARSGQLQRTTVELTGSVRTKVMVDGKDATPEQVGEVERWLGVDLDGDRHIAGGEWAPPGGAAGLFPGAVRPASTAPPPE